MLKACKWAERGARVNSISPGIIVIPLVIDEFNGPRGDFYKNMFAKCPAGRPHISFYFQRTTWNIVVLFGIIITKNYKFL